MESGHPTRQRPIVEEILQQKTVVTRRIHVKMQKQKVNDSITANPKRFLQRSMEGQALTRDRQPEISNHEGFWAEKWPESELERNFDAEDWFKRHVRDCEHLKQNPDQRNARIIQDGKLQDGEVLTHHNRVGNFTRINHSAESYI